MSQQTKIENRPTEAAALIELLRLHVEAGCDEILSAQPHDRTQKPKTISPPRKTIFSESEPGSQRTDTSRKPATLVTPRVRSIPNHQAARAAAQSAAENAHDVDALYHAVCNFDGCKLRTTALNTVFSDGIVDARIMLIGEAPGKDEDHQGKPFVGRSGQLLDHMLATIELSRKTNIYISNVIFWRPPGNRNPSSEERALCEPFTRRHIELVKPDILVAVGNIAAQALLENPNIRITRIRGQWQTYQPQGLNIPTLPILHPAYLLRRPDGKPDMWADLCALKARL